MSIPSTRLQMRCRARIGGIDCIHSVQRHAPPQVHASLRRKWRRERVGRLDSLARSASALSDSKDSRERDGAEKRQIAAVSTSKDSILTIFTWPVALARPAEVHLAGSFNNWDPIPLRKVAEGNEEYVRSVVLPPGPIQYKFITDGVWRVSPRVPITVGSDGTANNYHHVSVNAVISWQSEKPADNVFVSGSFVGWQELLPLQACSDGVHRVNCCLPPGKHHIQFLVDGSWFLNPELPTEADESGRQCNTIVTEVAESFQIFYMSSWLRPTLQSRLLDKDGRALEDWQTTPFERSQSRQAPWQSSRVDATRAGAANPAECRLEFTLEGPSGELDCLPGGKPYIVYAPGAYKLEMGVIKPFPQACAPPFMLVSDVDGTMIDETAEADAAAADFQRYWESVASLCSSVLVYNTGRSIGQLTGLLEYKRHCMTVPDVVITAVGTKIFMLNRKVTRQAAETDAWEEDLSYSALLDRDWDLRAVRMAAQRCISERCAWLDDGSEHPHRIVLSVQAGHVREVAERVRADVEAAGARVQVVVSGMGEWRYVDILSVHGGKMAAVEYVRRVFGIPRDRVVTAGDSGNDILMLEGENPAIVVGNAQPALLEWIVKQEQLSRRVILADKALAHGILEGLARHGLY